MPDLRIVNRSVYYEWLGKRDPANEPTLVLLSTEYRDAEGFKDLFASLGQRENVLCIDQTNMGKSSRIDRALSTDELIEETRLILNAEGVRRPLFFGYCPNVDIASRCASHIGGGAVLVSGLYRYRRERWVDLMYEVMFRHIRNKDVSALAEFMLLIVHSTQFFETTNFGMLVEKKELGERMKDPGFLFTSMQSRPVAPFNRDIFVRIPGPILLIKGERDPLTPLGVLREAFDGIPHRLEVLNAGHRLLDERLTDVTNLIEQLMQEHKSTSWVTGSTVGSPFTSRQCERSSLPAA